MNYIISSIVLLVITLVIIYLLSIDNNIDKFKNKFKETFSTFKSTEINYLNDIDSSILLHFLKSQYTQYDNIMIPKKVFYTGDKTGYIMKNIEIIGFTFNNNTFTENKHTITIKFITIKNELFVGRYTLFGQNGNYYIDQPINNIIEQPIDHIIEPIDHIIEPIVVKKKKTDIKQPIKSILSNKTKLDKQPNYEHDSLGNLNRHLPRAEVWSEINTTDIFDMIPDILHLSSNLEEDSDIITTLSPQTNQRA